MDMNARLALLKPESTTFTKTTQLMPFSNSVPAKLLYVHIRYSITWKKLKIQNNISYNLNMWFTSSTNFKWLCCVDITGRKHQKVLMKWDPMNEICKVFEDIPKINNQHDYLSCRCYYSKRKINFTYLKSLELHNIVNCSLLYQSKYNRMT